MALILHLGDVGEYMTQSWGLSVSHRESGAYSLGGDQWRGG